MLPFEAGRWPSIYDAESLRAAIREIVDAGPEFEARFYELGGLEKGGFACQGDIVELRAPLPVIDATGEPTVSDAEYDHWMIVGNTCDMDRADVLWSQIVPLVRVGRDLEPSELARFRRYEYYKSFYVSPWPAAPDQNHRLADFVQMASLEKSALREGAAKVVARLQFPAWALLHAFIVRFLARDDGRYD
jgi:hypothetical protein